MTGTRVDTAGVVRVDCQPRDGTKDVGSGYVVAPGIVLTSSHVVQYGSPAATLSISFLDGTTCSATVLACGARDGPDLALLALTDSTPRLEPVPFGAVDRTLAGEIPGCRAVGFPIWKNDDTAQLDGAIATAANLTVGAVGPLELRTTSTPRDRTAPGKSAWAGMSGAVVFTTGPDGTPVALGVVNLHHLPEGNSTVRVTPLISLPDEDVWKQHLRLDSPVRFPITTPADGPDRPSPAALAKIVRDHGQELGRARRGHRYLTDSDLPFVSPEGEDAAADPKQLWKNLSDRHDRSHSGHLKGVLLVGAAGAGKTRTCFEVAACATSGWRTLHVVPDATPSTDELVAVVRAQDATGVLLIFDYVDTYKHLDLGHFVESYFNTDAPIPDVACIATVRPGRLKEARDVTRGWFDQVTVPQGAKHQEAVARQIFATVATDAREHLGDEVLLEICGRRPVIALLIALQIAAVPVGDLDVPGLRANPGLLRWLRQRIHEDFPPDRTPGSGPAPVDDWLLASAVAATACAQPWGTVNAAVASFLAPAGPGRLGDADTVLGHLTALGWLVTNADNDLEAVHDQVVDQLLEEALFPTGMTIDVVAARLLLSALLVDARTFGRASTHLARWTADLPTEHRDEMTRLCAAWLEDNATTIVGHLAHPDRRHDGSRTLVTMVSDEPWRDGIAAHWDTVVTPWVEAVEATSPRLARDTFATAVRTLADAVPEPLIATVLAWLEERHTEVTASSVIEAMLYTARSAPWADTVATYGLTWLDTHPRAWGTSYVLAGLFAARGLSPDLTTRTVALASDWMTSPKFGSQSTTFILRQWLENDTLVATQARAGVEYGIAWLARPDDLPRSASFVLRPLLTNPQVTDAELPGLVAATTRWLEDFGTGDEAYFVLRGLLDCRAVDAWSTALPAALTWLRAQGTHTNAGPLISALLENRALRAERLDVVIGHAVDWLGTPRGEGEDGSFVLEAALRRLNAARRRGHDVARRDALLDRADGWLRTHPGYAAFSFVLAPFLRAAAPEPQRHEWAVDQALTWLEDSLTDDHVSFVLEGLCSPEYVEPGRRHAETILDRAVAWLRTEPPALKVLHVALPLLEHADLNQAQRDVVTRSALRAIDAHPAHAMVAPLVTRLIMLGQLAPEVADLLAEHGLRRLDRLGVKQRGRLLTALLRRGDLSPSQLDAVADAAMAWLDGRVTRSNVGTTVRALALQRRLGASRSRQIADLTLEWQRAHPTTGFAGGVLLALAEMPGLDERRRADIRAALTAWQESR